MNNGIFGKGSLGATQVHLPDFSKIGTANQPTTVSMPDLSRVGTQPATVSMPDLSKIGTAKAPTLITLPDRSGKIQLPNILLAQPSQPEAAAAGGGVGLGTIAIIGGIAVVGIVAVMMLRKPR